MVEYVHQSMHQLVQDAGEAILHQLCFFKLVGCTTRVKRIAPGGWYKSKTPIFENGLALLVLAPLHPPNLVAAVVCITLSCIASYPVHCIGITNQQIHESGLVPAPYTQMVLASIFRMMLMLLLTCNTVLLTEAAIHILEIPAILARPDQSNLHVQVTFKFHAESTSLFISQT